MNLIDNGPAPENKPNPSLAPPKVNSEIYLDKIVDIDEIKDNSMIIFKVTK
jgi:hypothetical protein